MYKVIMMFKKHPQLSRKEFMNYYDNHHVPSIRALLPVKSSLHRRNFVLPASGEEPAYDCITEVIYDTEEQARAASRYMSDPEIRRAIDEDEARFILPGSMKIFRVEVHEDDFGHQVGEASI